MIQVGAATIDITPPDGQAMAGYAARTGVAVGAHDALTVRALVVDDTAVVTIDVIGIDADFSARATRGRPGHHQPKARMPVGWCGCGAGVCQ